jgi:hypothetical protein
VLAVWKAGCAPAHGEGCCVGASGQAIALPALEVVHLILSRKQSFSLDFCDVQMVYLALSALSVADCRREPTAPLAQPLTLAALLAVLRALVKYRTTDLDSSVGAYLALVQHASTAFFSLAARSRAAASKGRAEGAQLGAASEADVNSLCQSLSRLLQELGDKKRAKILNKYIVYLLAHLVGLLETLPVLTRHRQALLPGICALLDLCQTIE